MGKYALLAAFLAASTTTAIPHGSKKGSGGGGQILLPMDDSTHGASFNITLGTPAQTLTLLADWTWQTTWVDTPDCFGSYNVNCIPKGQNFFDNAASTTYKADKEYAIQSWGGTDYTPGLAFRNDFGTDKLCFHSSANSQELCSDKIEISVSNFTIPLPVVFDIGGVFGLAPVLHEYNATFQPTAYQMWKQGLLSPRNGWHMCGLLKDKSTCYGKAYLTILGGTDTSVYDPKKTVYHQSLFSKCVNAGPHLNLDPPRYNYWSTSWTEMWIGSKSFSLKAKDSPSYNATTASPECDPIDPIAVFDQDKFGYGAAMPVAAFEALVSITNAKIAYNNNNPGVSIVNSGNSSIWAVDCSKLSSFPTLTYEFARKQNITLVPSQYVDTKLHAGECFLNARPWDRALEGALTFFGLTVLSRTYVEFDFGTNKVGLTPLNENLY